MKTCVAAKHQNVVGRFCLPIQIGLGGKVCVLCKWAKKNLSVGKKLGQNPLWRAQLHVQLLPVLPFLDYEYKNAFSTEFSQVDVGWE
jgi:hypothetical protein